MCFSTSSSLRNCPVFITDLELKWKAWIISTTQELLSPAPAFLFPLCLEIHLHPKLSHFFAHSFTGSDNGPCLYWSHIPNRSLTLRASEFFTRVSSTVTGSDWTAVEGVFQHCMHRALAKASPGEMVTFLVYIYSQTFPITGLCNVLHLSQHIRVKKKKKRKMIVEVPNIILTCILS